MVRPDSIRFSREASQCEIAAKIASFLESYVPRTSYKFSLSDLLTFNDERVLLELRSNPIWQAYESEFKAVGGAVLEDWDDEEIQPKLLKSL